MKRFRELLLGLAVVVASSCGSGSDAPGAAPGVSAGSELPGAELEGPPARLTVEDIADFQSRPRAMAGVGEWRLIAYEATDGTGRTPSFTLIVTRTPMPSVRGATSMVDVAGKSATLASRYLGDGVVVPILIIPMWSDAVVEIQATSADTTVEQLVAGAKLIRPLTAAQWRTRLKELSYDTRNANTDPQSTRIDLGEHRADAVSWRATLIVPSDFPLSAGDRRRPCLEPLVQRDGRHREQLRRRLDDPARARYALHPWHHWRRRRIDHVAVGGAAGRSDRRGV